MTGSATFKIAVNLRTQCPPVRDQGPNRLSCLALAASDAHGMEHGCTPLSAEYLFYHACQIAGTSARGLLFEEVARALEKNGQPAETEWPYSTTQADPWIVPTVSTLWHGSLTHSSADASVNIEDMLRAGRPVIVAVRISAKLVLPEMPGATIDADGMGYQGHALLAVGLGACSKAGKRFLVRNSWGSAWGDGGYAWLASDYLNDKLVGYAPVTAKP